MAARTTLAGITMLAVALGWGPPAASGAERYAHFRAAVYARAYEVREMGDLEALRARFALMEAQAGVSKIYLETHRDKLLVDDATLEKAKRFFADRGIATAGGITLTVDERNRFQTFCYSDPEDRRWVQKVVERTARHFDEIILDDFFFTSCKSEAEIRARGGRSWTAYRLALLDQAARDLVLEPARRVNPKVRVTIKYPNWYPHFPALGFDLAEGPRLFDAIYTGTETRDAERSAQHLQPYQGYEIWRYLENLRPGRNGGGWVDTGGMRYLDRYAEQLWLTLFAKAPEITLFDFRQMQLPVRPGHRAPWQGQGTSLDFDAVVGPFRRDDGSFSPELTMARVAGWSLAKVDPLIGRLGRPVGVAGYRPVHGAGEDFLPSFLGMIGIPIELGPRFPEEAPLVLLTEAAASDAGIVGKIDRQLRAGRSVLVTSGLLRALRGRGIERIAELRMLAARALVGTFRVGWNAAVSSPDKILIPQLHYFTNDSWSLIDASDGPMGWPLLLDAPYAAGHLYLLTVPDNFADLYRLPAEVLQEIRRVASQGLGLRLEGPSQVSLFLYDNDTLVVESFRDQAVEAGLIAAPGVTALRDLETGERLPAETIPAGQGFFRSPDAGRTRIRLPVKPHSYRAFQVIR